MWITEGAQSVGPVRLADYQMQWKFIAHEASSDSGREKKKVIVGRKQSKILTGLKNSIGKLKVPNTHDSISMRSDSIVSFRNSDRKKFPFNKDSAIRSKLKEGKYKDFSSDPDMLDSDDANNDASIRHPDSEWSQVKVNLPAIKSEPNETPSP